MRVYGTDVNNRTAFRHMRHGVLAKRNTERKFTPITRSQSSSGVSTSGEKVIIAASLTTTSTLPHFSSMTLIAACTAGNRRHWF
jgi:hypothetical protein